MVIGFEIEFEREQDLVSHGEEVEEGFLTKASLLWICSWSLGGSQSRMSEREDASGMSSLPLDSRKALRRSRM